MFKTLILATALVAVEAWERDVKADAFQTEAYGVDNQYYGTQGYKGMNYGYGKADKDNVGLHGGHGGVGKGNAAWNEATSHNSYRQSGHQGQGHNQWVDNAWNQWGTNNHFDAQKSVDNKWGNQSGKINVTLNAVSGHYDADYGQQQRGIGYEGHQNTSGEIGYTTGLAGHSFGYADGDHSYGYDNREDYGYGGWANNLGAFNHGANYDNFGDQFVETGRDQYNDARDSADIKMNRRVGAGYADLEAADDDDDWQDQYANYNVQVTNRNSGTRNTLDVFAGQDDSLYSSNAGFGVDIGGFSKGDIYDHIGTAYGGRFGGYGRGYADFGHGRLYGRAVGGYGKGLVNGSENAGDEAYGDADEEYGKGVSYGYGGYGLLGGGYGGRGYGYGGLGGYGLYGGYGGGRAYGRGYGRGYDRKERPLGGDLLGRGRKDVMKKW